MRFKGESVAEEEKKDGEEAPAEEGKKKKSPMTLIIIAIAALLLIVAIVVVVLILSGEETPQQGEVTGNRDTASNQIRATTGAQLGPVVPMEQFIVNLVSNDGRRYLKAELQFELSDNGLMDEASNKQPLIRDVIIRTLSSKTYEEVSTENGKLRLKEELIGNINAQLIDGEVVNIFFTKFVVQ